MFEAGDKVRWMCPLDADYTYGEIIRILQHTALVRGTGLYRGSTIEVHLRYIEKVNGGKRENGSSSKRKL